jgi:peptidoglycan/xylan/chitin deacetylase (PgdA/CDA1 family)
MQWPGAAILCYHGVTGPHLPSFNLANIPIEEITQTLMALRNDRVIVPLGELLHRHAAGRSVSGLAAVTFDDAYQSLAELLAPWLYNQGIPCSIFVTTNASRAGEAFWWDRVEDIYPRVTIERWRTFEDELGLPEDFRSGQPAIFGPIRPLRQYILAQFEGRWPSAHEEALRVLECEVGGGTLQRAMSFAELTSISKHGGVEIGVHTCTHPVLPLLSDADIVAEIGGCLEELRAKFDCTIPVLALPFGLFNSRVLRLASEAGVGASLTLANRLVRRRGTKTGIHRISMTRGSATWRRRLQWIGITEHLRALRDLGRATEQFPALPSTST